MSSEALFIVICIVGLLCLTVERKVAWFISMEFVWLFYVHFSCLRYN